MDVCNLVVCSIFLVGVTVVLAFVEGDKVVVVGFVVAAFGFVVLSDSETRGMDLIRKVSINFKVRQ